MRERLADTATSVHKSGKVPTIEACPGPGAHAAEGAGPRIARCGGYSLFDHPSRRLKWSELGACGCLGTFRLVNRAHFYLYRFKEKVST